MYYNERKRVQLNIFLCDFFSLFCILTLTIMMCEYIRFLFQIRICYVTMPVFCALCKMVHIVKIILSKPKNSLVFSAPPPPPKVYVLQALAK